MGKRGGEATGRGAGPEREGPEMTKGRTRTGDRRTERGTKKVPLKRKRAHPLAVHRSPRGEGPKPHQHETQTR